MARRQKPNPRLVKLHYSHTVEEAARTLGVHKHTVRRWIENGLPTVDRHRPTLILGSALRRFLEDRRARARCPCPPGHIYCVKCRTPKSPALDMADYLPATVNSGNLRALCPDCGTLMHRRIALVRIDAVFPKIAVTFPQADPRIGD